MTAPPLTAPAPPPVPRARAIGTGPAPRWRLALLACFVVAALSLVLPSEPTYDPWAWLIWGRAITELDLVTTSGPSWKPLPVLFTVPFALFGEAAPELWLVVARAGGLFAVVLAFRLGARLAGPAAGAIAAVGLFFADQFVRHFVRGNSEGLLVAACLWALERHLDGRRRDAFLLLLAAALLRPEVWPFFGLYGLWLAWRRPEARVLVGGAFAVTGLLWFVPEYIGSGNLLRAASRALEVNPGSAGETARPVLEVFRRASGILMVPIWAGSAIAVAAAAARLRARRPAPTDVIVLAIAGVAFVLVLGVGLMAEVGFAGNIRYVALPAAMVCIVAGAGWIQAFRALDVRQGRARALTAAALCAVAAVPFAVRDAGEFGDQMRTVRVEADFYADLDRVIAATGGPDAANRCGIALTDDYEVQALAWRLHRHSKDVGLEGDPPGTAFAPRGSDIARDDRFPKIFETAQWIVRRRCST